MSKINLKELGEIHRKFINREIGLVASAGQLHDSETILKLIECLELVKEAIMRVDFEPTTPAGDSVISFLKDKIEWDK